MLGRTRRVHFVGIGGSGMSGIAELLANLGYVVSGSDVKLSAVTERLERLGVVVHEGHDARFARDADVVVVSSAVGRGNPEVAEAHRRHIPAIPRAEMLSELMRLRYGIAVAGSHGKTSTTSMIALILERAGLDPTAVIGGRLSAFGSNARLGRGDFMVAEADESDRSFLTLSPAVAVITNVDYEHLESYGSFDSLCAAFVDFANKVPFYGAIVACVDDERVRPLLTKMSGRVITYGLDVESSADLMGEDVQLRAFGASCTLHSRPRGEHAHTRLGVLQLQVPGRHNLRNALAATAVGLELGVSLADIVDALAGFRGVERRFQFRGEIDGVMVVDDYGHHPSEITAVLEAAHAGFHRRVFVVFQPHRYTRTSRLLPEFGMALAGADEIILTDIYSAGEDPIPGVTVEAVADAVRHAGAISVRVVKTLEQVADAVVHAVKPGDVVITLGAGSIGGVAGRIVDALEQRRAARPDSVNTNHC